MVLKLIILVFPSVRELGMILFSDHIVISLFISMLLFCVRSMIDLSFYDRTMIEL